MAATADWGKIIQENFPILEHLDQTQKKYAQTWQSLNM